MHEWSYRRLSQLVRPYAWTMRTPGHWDGHAMGRTRPLRKRSWMRTRSRARQQQMLGKGGHKGAERSTDSKRYTSEVVCPKHSCPVVSGLVRTSVSQFWP